jgi:hypothetical protein
MANHRGTSLQWLPQNQWLTTMAAKAKQCRPAGFSSDVFLALLILAVSHINSMSTLAQISMASKRCRAICSLLSGTNSGVAA